MDFETADAIVMESGSLEHREGYSGRGMMGAETHAIVGDEDDFERAKMEAHEKALDSDEDELADKLKGPFIKDEMGLKMVFY